MEDFINKIKGYFQPKVNTPIPIDQYMGKNPAKTPAETGQILPGENEWVAMMLNKKDGQTASDLHNLYHKAIKSPGATGNYYQQPGAKPTAQPSPTGQMPKLIDKTGGQGSVMGAQTQAPVPSITPFPEDPLNGYVNGTPKEYISLIDQAAKQTGMPTALLSALLAHESMRWNSDVITGSLNSPVGAQGIGQFMPATAQGLGIDPLDPSQAIPAAAKYFMSQYHRYGRPDYALAGYNAGGAAVNKYHGIPPYKETQDYVRNILQDANTTFGR